MITLLVFRVTGSSPVGRGGGGGGGGGDLDDAWGSRIMLCCLQGQLVLLNWWFGKHQNRGMWKPH